MAVAFNDYMPIIWNRLVAEIGNEYGVAGLMGNLYAESGCTPYACQPSRPLDTCMTYIGRVDRHEITEYSFVHRGCSSTGGVANGQGGFGLAQWTYYTRKQKLYDKWLIYGGSIGSIDLQIAYLIEELQNDYSSVWNTLISAGSVREASDAVLHYYESPKDQSTSVEERRESYGNDIYNAYAGTTPVEPADPVPPSPYAPNPEPQPPIIAHESLESHLPIWMYPPLRR